MISLLNAYNYALSTGEKLPPYASPGIYITYEAIIPSKNGSIVRNVRYEVLSIEAVNETMTIRLTIVQNKSIVKSEIYKDNIFLPVHFPAIDPRLLTKTYTRPGFLGFQRIVFEDSVILVSNSKTFKTFKYRIINDPYNTTVYIDIDMGILVKIFDVKGFVMIVKNTNINITKTVTSTPTKTSEITTTEGVFNTNFMVMIFVIAGSMLGIIALIIHKLMKK